jgi:D-beta-D-heptose 7-phosphate kinase/D-beta-D-heptose 1-phosphate adenosyltransferase
MIIVILNGASEFDPILKRFSGRRLVVLGDVVLDRYWWGEATRLSPEAPVPVVLARRSTTRPGGAANVAANLAALGATVELFGVTGVDSGAVELRDALSECGIGAEFLYEEPGRPTTTKTRVIALHQQVVRVDHEDTSPVSETCAARTIELAAQRLPLADAVVISDYAKGFLSPPVLSRLMEMAARMNKPVFVDPKGADRSRYLGCTLLKPNRAELSLLTGLAVHSHAETIVAGSDLAARMPGTRVLVTEGPDGMTLFQASQAPEHVAGLPRQVYDVTGAGDTVLATLALSICAGASYAQAMRLAIQAAAIAVGLVGTATVSRRDLETALREITERAAAL